MCQVLRDSLYLETRRLCIGPIICSMTPYCGIPTCHFSLSLDGDTDRMLWEFIVLKLL